MDDKRRLLGNRPGPRDHIGIWRRWLTELTNYPAWDRDVDLWQSVDVAIGHIEAIRHRGSEFEISMLYDVFEIIGPDGLGQGFLYQPLQPSYRYGDLVAGLEGGRRLRYWGQTDQAGQLGPARRHHDDQGRRRSDLQG